MVPWAPGTTSATAGPALRRAGLAGCGAVSAAPATPIGRERLFRQWDVAIWISEQRPHAANAFVDAVFGIRQIAQAALRRTPRKTASPRGPPRRTCRHLPLQYEALVDVILLCFAVLPSASGVRHRRAVN